MSIPLREIVYTSLIGPSPLEAYRPGAGRRLIDFGIAGKARGGAGPDFNFILISSPVDLAATLACARDFFGDEVFGVSVEIERAEGSEGLRVGHAPDR